MTTATLKVAKLNSEKLDKVKTLEETLGSTVVAYKPDASFASMTDKEVAKLQATEKELGMVLLAFEQE